MKFKIHSMLQSDLVQDYRKKNLVVQLHAYGFRDEIFINKVLDLYIQSNPEKSLDEFLLEYLFQIKEPDKKEIAKMRLALFLLESEDFKKPNIILQKQIEISRFVPDLKGISRMIPRPIDFNPLQRFKPESWDKIDYITLMITILFWSITYAGIFYFLYS